FAAGDSENSSNDTEEHVIPQMEAIPANLHAYVETQPSGNAINATHAEEVERHFHGSDNVAVAYVNGPGDVVDAIETILNTEDDNDCPHQRTANGPQPRRAGERGCEPRPQAGTRSLSGELLDRRLR